MTVGPPLSLRLTPFSVAQMQTTYLAYQFGIFHHFSMATFCDQQVPPTQNPNVFNPSALNTDQWLGQ